MAAFLFSEKEDIIIINFRNKGLETMTAKVLSKLKTSIVLQIILGLFLLLVFSTGFVYYHRVIYEPPWLSQYSGTIIIFFFLALVFSLGFILIRISKTNDSLAKALMIFVIGLGFVFATPPNQVPDEPGHFMRAYAMFQGEYGFDSGHKYPNQVNLFAEDFPSMYNNGYPAQKDSTILNCFVNYQNHLKEGKKVDNMKIIIFQTIPYLFSVLGMHLANLLGLETLGLFYVARIFNLIFYALSVYISLSIAKKFRNLLFCVASLPLTLFLAASCNSDSFYFALMLIMFSLFLSDNFDYLKSYLFMFIFSLLCIHKMSYIVFLILPFIIKKEEWNIDTGESEELEKMSQLTFVVGTLAMMFLFHLLHNSYTTHFSNYGPLGRLMPDSDPSEQLKYCFQYPFRFIVVFINTLVNNKFFLFDGGLLGWLDVDLQLISFLTPILILIYCVDASQEYNEKDIRKTVVFLSASLLTYIVVMCGLYLTWTPVSLPQIIGLQMRYFIPAFFGFGLTAVSIFSACGIQIKQNNTTLLLSCTYVLNLMTIYLMLIAYYCPALL